MQCQKMILNKQAISIWFLFTYNSEALFMSLSNEKEDRLSSEGSNLMCMFSGMLVEYCLQRGCMYEYDRSGLTEWNKTKCGESYWPFRYDQFFSPVQFRSESAATTPVTLCSEHWFYHRSKFNLTSFLDYANYLFSYSYWFYDFYRFKIAIFRTNKKFCMPSCSESVHCLAW